jgi:predicted molibdopterin-dependent oxidoreductase YjgC
MGSEPKLLAGYVPLTEHRGRFEAAWQVPLPTNPGINMIEMMEAADAGKLKVLWSIGYDIVMTNPNMHYTRRAMEKLDLVIVQDIFINETAKEFGDVFLPAASSFEKDGTFMNGERRIQRVRQAVPPQGDDTRLPTTPRNCRHRAARSTILRAICATATCSACCSTSTGCCRRARSCRTARRRASRWPT